MNLYDMTEQLRDLLELAQYGGEGVDYTEMLEGMEGAYSDKLDGYCKIIKQLEADAAALDAESLRLSQRKTTIENNIKRMKEAVKVSLMRTGTDKHKSLLFTVTVSKPRQRVEVTNIDAVPSEFLKQSDPTVDKKLVMEKIKAGEIVHGCSLVDGERGLTIR